MDEFFERLHRTGSETNGRGNGRDPRGRAVVENDLSPKLRDLAKHLKAMLTSIEDEEEIAEIDEPGATRCRGTGRGDRGDRSGRAWRTPCTGSRSPAGRPRRVEPARRARSTWRRACGEQLFEQDAERGDDQRDAVHGGGGRRQNADCPPPCGTGVPPVQSRPRATTSRFAKARYLPHWTKTGGDLRGHLSPRRFPTHRSPAKPWRSNARTS